MEAIVGVVKANFVKNLYLAAFSFISLIFLMNPWNFYVYFTHKNSPCNEKLSHVILAVAVSSSVVWILALILFIISRRRHMPTWPLLLLGCVNASMATAISLLQTWIADTSADTCQHEVYYTSIAILVVYYTSIIPALWLLIRRGLGSMENAKILAGQLFANLKTESRWMIGALLGFGLMMSCIPVVTAAASSYNGQCERPLAQWLVAFCVTTPLAWGLTASAAGIQNNARRLALSCLGLLLLIGWTAFIIVGTVWRFSISDTECTASLMRTSFWSLIVSWVFIGFLFLVICCGCMCAICLRGASNADEEEEDGKSVTTPMIAAAASND